MMVTAYDFEATSLDGKPRPLREFNGKVLLIVNTASKCGFTPQYRGLETLFRKYRDRGFEVLGFPCNQFGRQEPGSESEIGTFCYENYGVSFPMFEKIDVNGESAHPLYGWLQANAPGILGIKRIKWNFTKFLIDRKGNVAERFAPATKPESLEKEVEKLLQGL
jgi:glutathione peroxidase